MKKTWQRGLAMVLIVAVFHLSLTASAQAVNDDSIYSYKVTEDGTAVISVGVLLDQSTTADFWQLPDTIDGYTVTGVDLFMSGIQAKALVLPSTLKTLQPYALGMYLEDVYLPEGLETISYYVTLYGNTQQMNHIVIPTTVTEIAEKAFGWQSAPSVNGSVGGVVQTDDFTVYSDGNEVAREYAEKEGYTYIDLSTYERGDMDLNGTIDMMDVLHVYRIAAGTTYGSPVQRVMGECNRDGAINMLDAVASYAQASGYA